MADVKKNYTGSEKLITSDILFQNMKNFDKRREDKVHEKLYVKIPEVPAHYEKAESTTPSALEIIDNTSSVVGSQIKLDDVTPVADGYTPVVGEYTVYVALVPASEKEKYLKEADLQIEESLLDLSEFDNVTP